MRQFYLFATALLAFALSFLMPAQVQAQNVWDGSIDLTWYDADQNSFDISTPGQLAGVAQLVNGGIASFSGKTLNLTDDIWLNYTGDSTNNWVPIGGGATPTGESTSSGYSFKGTFNGHGHTIYNLYCDKTNYFHAGLFGCIETPCTIGSLVMINPILKFPQALPAPPRPNTTISAVLSEPATPSVPVTPLTFKTAASRAR